MPGPRSVAGECYETISATRVRSSVAVCATIAGGAWQSKPRFWLRASVENGKRRSLLQPAATTGEAKRNGRVRQLTSRLATGFAFPNTETGRWKQWKESRW